MPWQRVAGNSASASPSTCHSIAPVGSRNVCLGRKADIRRSSLNVRLSHLWERSGENLPRSLLRQSVLLEIEASERQKLPGSAASHQGFDHTEHLPVGLILTTLRYGHSCVMNYGCVPGNRDGRRCQFILEGLALLILESRPLFHRFLVPRERPTIVPRDDSVVNVIAGPTPAARDLIGPRLFDYIPDCGLFIRPGRCLRE